MEKIIVGTMLKARAERILEEAVTKAYLTTVSNILECETKKGVVFVNLQTKQSAKKLEDLLSEKQLVDMPKEEFTLLISRDKVTPPVITKQKEKVVTVRKERKTATKKTGTKKAK